jgi:hypothetical protein
VKAFFCLHAGQIFLRCVFLLLIITHPGFGGTGLSVARFVIPIASFHGVFPLTTLRAYQGLILPDSGKIINLSAEITPKMSLIQVNPVLAEFSVGKIAVTTLFFF